MNAVAWEDAARRAGSQPPPRMSHPSSHAGACLAAHTRLTRPRSIAQIVSAEFLATKARLEELIYSARHDPTEEENYPIMGRMTNVADNVE